MDRFLLILRLATRWRRELEHRSAIGGRPVHQTFNRVLAALKSDAEEVARGIRNHAIDGVCAIGQGSGECVKHGELRCRPACARSGAAMMAVPMTALPAEYILLSADMES